MAAVDSSEPASEAESSSGSFDLGPELVRQLRLELEAEKRQNKNLVAKLKRATKLNEQLVRACAPQRAQRRRLVRGGRLRSDAAAPAPPAQAPARALPPLRCRGRPALICAPCPCRSARSKPRRSRRRSTSPTS
jgi:hypothetical protein